MPSPRRIPHLSLALVLAALVLFPRSLLLTSAHNESSDDDYHLVRGLEFLRGDRGLLHRELNDPPLGQAISAVPLYLLGGTTHGLVENTALYGQRNYTPETATRLIALWKTFLFLPFLALIFVWARRLYGLPSAYLAVAIFTLEPTFAAHLHLASLDVLATTGILLACYLGWRFFEHPTRSRLVLAAFACAVALLLKHTAVLVPLVLLAGAGLCANRRRVFRLLPTAAILVLLFVWVLSKFDVSPVRQQGGRVTARAYPMGIYVQSVLDAGRHVREPNDAYLFGEVRRGGWWYYFPAVATFKVPLVIAVLLLAAVLSLFGRKVERDEWFVLLPMGAYTLFMLAQSLNIGWRHFLPAYAFMLMFATRYFVLLGRSSLRTAAVATVTAILAIENVLWFPDYIAYANVPRANAHLAISDSNVDWGQGLKQARRWIDSHADLTGGRPVYIRPVAASGRAVRHYLGDRAAHLKFSDRPPASGLLIVSPVALTGLSESNDEYAFLRDKAPVAIIGRVLRVYDLDALGR